MNYNIKLLSYLKQYENDGEMHSLEFLFTELSISSKRAIFEKLAKLNFIILGGGELPELWIGQIGLSTGGLRGERIVDEFEAKITIKGSIFLEEAIEMQLAGKFNIESECKVINFADASYLRMIKSKPDFIEKMDEIIQKIINDESVTENLKDEAISYFQKAKAKVNKSGKMPKKFREKTREFERKISSIRRVLE